MMHMVAGAAATTWAVALKLPLARLSSDAQLRQRMKLEMTLGQLDLHVMFCSFSSQ